MSVLKAFIMSFELLPIGAFFLKASPTVEFVEEVSHVFVIGALMAAPFIALNFLVQRFLCRAWQSGSEDECVHDQFCH